MSPGNPWAPVRWRVLSWDTRPNKELHCDDVYSCEKRNHLISNQEKNRPRAVSTWGGGGLPSSDNERAKLHGGVSDNDAR